MLSQSTFFIIVWILLSLTLIVTMYIAVTSNTIFATFSLTIVFICISFILLLINVEFLGIIYLSIYVGAVSVFFLFILFLFDLRIDHVAEKKSNKLMPELWVLGIYIITTLIFGATCFYSFKKDKIHGPMSQWLLEWRKKQLQLNPTKLDKDLKYVHYENTDLRNYINMHQNDMSLSASESAQTVKQCASLINEINYQASNSVYQIGYQLYNEHYILVILSAAILLLSMIAGLALVVNTPYVRKNSIYKAEELIEKRIERLKIKLLSTYLEELEAIQKEEDEKELKKKRETKETDVVKEN